MCTLRGSSYSLTWKPLELPAIRTEEPYASFFVGDVNAHCHNWWSDGGTNEKGRQIDDLTSSLSLDQLIMEPTNFVLNKTPSCRPHLY